MHKYRKWIKENVPTYCVCMCEKATLKMQKTFPELIRVKGFYHCPKWGKSAHWWLKTTAGTIVDPTISQFLPNGHYEEWKEGRD